MPKWTPPKPVVEKKPDPLDFDIEVVAVPRAFLREHGWPHSYAALKATHEVRYTRRFDLVMLSYQETGIAFFRDGGDDVPCLYVQSWSGAA